jgi:hypothetical protein
MPTEGDNPMSLLTDKDLIAWEPSLGQYRPRLAAIIGQAEARASSFCGFRLESSSRAEWYDVPNHTRRIVLRSFPVSSVSEVLENAQATSPTERVAADYIIDLRAGILDGYGRDWIPGSQALKVTYTAGFTVAMLADEDYQGPDLKEALMMTCLWLLEGRRQSLGVQTERTEGHQVTWSRRNGSLPPEIEGDLEKFARLNMIA